jgi:hypothetical protein
MVHRLLDVLMQDAWSLTAFDNLASRPGQIHAAFFLAGFLFISNTASIASVKITLIDELLGSLRLEFWRLKM